MSKSDTRIIFTDEYYILQAIFLSEKFTQILATFNEALDKINCPIPDTGFKSAKEFKEWQNKTLKHDKSYSSFVREIISEFHLDKNNPAFFSGIVFKVFFKVEEIPTKTTITSHISSLNDDLPKEIWVRILPNTTEDDYKNHWSRITELKKLLPHYKRTFNKKWREFDRDLELYKLFLKVEQNVKKGILKSTANISRGSGVSESPYVQMIQYEEYKSIMGSNSDNFDIERKMREIKTRLQNVNLI